MGERGIRTHYVQGKEKGKQRALANLLGEDYMIFRGVHWLEKHNIQDSPFGLWVWCHLWTCFQTLEGGSHSYTLFLPACSHGQVLGLWMRKGGQRDLKGASLVLWP